MEPQHPHSKQQGDQTTSPAHTNTLSSHDNTIVVEGDCVCVYECVVGGVGWFSGFPLESETNGVREIHFPVGTDR